MSETADNTPAAARAREEDTTAPPDAGLIGLGPPGISVAIRLHAAGFRLTLWDDRAERRDACEALLAGARFAPPESLARCCTVVLLVQSLGEDMATVHGTLAGAMAPGSLVVDMGPSLPGEVRRLAAALAERGLRLVDAPTIATGSADQPVIVLAGGAEADVTLATPLLRAIGAVLPTGPVGSAQALAALAAELETPPDLPSLSALIE